MGPKAPGIRTAPREPKAAWAAWAPMVRRDAGRLLPAPAWDPAAVPASSGPQLPTCAHCTLPSLTSPALAQPQPTPHPLRPLCRLLSVPDSFDLLTPPPKPFRWLPMHPSQAPGAWPCSPVPHPEGTKFSAASGPLPSSRGPRLPSGPRLGLAPPPLRPGPSCCLHRWVLRPRAAAPPQEGSRCYQEPAWAFLQDGLP